MRPFTDHEVENLNGRKSFLTMTAHSPAFISRPHPHLYEINTWVWLQELSRTMNRTIRLGDVPDREWDELQARGFDYIWLMGIWERSLLGDCAATCGFTERVCQSPSGVAGIGCRRFSLCGPGLPA